MTQIEQIKAEIERLKEHNRQFIFASAAQVSMEAGVKQEAYNEVLAFIDSIPADSDKPKGFDADYLQSCIDKATENGSWKGVDADKFMDEVRESASPDFEAE